MEYAVIISANLGLQCTFVGPSGLHANLVNSNVVRAVRRRGNVNDGRNYGPRYVNANNATSNANWNYGSGNYPISSQANSILCLKLCAAFPRFRQRNRNTIRLESAW